MEIINSKINFLITVQSLYNNKIIKHNKLLKLRICFDKQIYIVKLCITRIKLI